MWRVLLFVIFIWCNRSSRLSRYDSFLEIYYVNEAQYRAKFHVTLHCQKLLSTTRQREDPLKIPGRLGLDKDLVPWRLHCFLPTLHIAASLCHGSYLAFSLGFCPPCAPFILDRIIFLLVFYLHVSSGVFSSLLAVIDRSQVSRKSNNKIRRLVWRIFTCSTAQANKWDMFKFSNVFSSDDGTTYVQTWYGSRDLSHCNINRISYRGIRA